MTKVKLRLYILGGTPASQKAVGNLKTILETEKTTKGNYELEVVDVLKKPQLAEDEKIMATPALLKVLPEPVRRILGDLSDKQKVLLGLDLVKVKDEEKIKSKEIVKK